MKILLYLSALIAACALLLIAIFIIKTAKTVKQAMGDVTETMKRVEMKVSTITDKTDRLIDQTNRIADDAETKLQSVNGLADSAKELGNTTKYVQHSIQRLSDQVAAPPAKYAKLMQQATALSEAAAQMYYGMKRQNGKR